MAVKTRFTNKPRIRSNTTNMTNQNMCRSGQGRRMGGRMGQSRMRLKHPDRGR